VGAVDAFPQLDVADGAGVVRRAAVQGLTPEPELRVSEWAARYRKLTTKTSSEPGEWRNARTPYLVEIMDCLSVGHPCEEVWFQKGTQVGATECGNNWLGYVIHLNPAPMMAIQPTLNMAKRFSKQRLATMIESMFVLRERISEKRSRDSANTTLMKDFDGGMLVVAGANSAADLRSMPCKYIFADEIDGYPWDVDGEGDPLILAFRRTTNFPRRKKYLPSSPTTKGFSRVEQGMATTDFRRYHVPCPHCGHFQYLKWANLAWEKDPAHRPETAHYVCEAGGCVIDEHHKTGMLARGVWIADFPGRGEGKRIGYHLPTLYSPLGWESWASMVEQFLEAKRVLDGGDDTKMKAFVNLCLAETWEEQADKVEHGALQARAERYELRTVPMGGLVLTMAVDTQANRLEYAIKAWGRFEESWVVDYGVIHGDPGASGDGSVWEEVARLVRTPLKHANGREMRILATAVDSGGHHTHQVYQFCRQHRGLGVVAVKGHSHAGKPILGKPTKVDINLRGEKLSRGVDLWLIGTDTAKSLIYGRLRLKDEGPGFVHFSDALPGDYYEQLTSERLLTRYVKGRPRLEWIKPSGTRNEGLDLEVYNLFCAHRLQLHRYTAPDWDALERRVQPVQRDMLDPPPAAAAPPAPRETLQTSTAPAGRMRRRGSFRRR
jgi:phage terminase large subunit GpA-like protein